MPSAGTLIYVGFVPIIKTALCIGAGFLLAKKGLFPVTATKGAGHLAMDVALPCLVFSSIVPSFNSDNIASLGPLCLNALVYQICGALMGMLIKEFFWVPQDFRYGIVIACAFSNWGNLPTAIVQSIAQGEPFDKTKDPALGVAYVAVFILIYNVTFFGLGLCKICAWDFRPRPEGSEPATIRQKWAQRRRWALQTYRKLQQRIHPKSQSQVEADKVGDFDATSAEAVNGKAAASSGAVAYSGGMPLLTSITSRQLTRYQSQQETLNANQRHHDAIALRPVRSRTRPPMDRNRSVLPVTDDAIEPVLSHDNMDAAADLDEKDHSGVIIAPEFAPEDEEEDEPKRTRWQAIKHFLGLFLTPIVISLFAALPIALISPLKALFTHVDGWTVTRIPNGPDGRPPLAFLLDTTSFIGALCIPVALILMGASFSRLKIPRPITGLPLGAIVAVTIAKMVILPVIGVLMTNGLSNTTNLYPKSNKILIFVAMLLSGTPSAANQLVITTIYSPDSSADTLSAFMLLQYIFMLFASTALAAVSLSIVSAG